MAPESVGLDFLCTYRPPNKRDFPNSNGKLDMGCATPKLEELLPQDPELIPLLMNREQLIRVADRLVHHQALDSLQRDVRRFFEENDEMGPAEFKNITGLSRRHAIPLLEWLDTQGVTVRKGNTRVLKFK